MKAFNIPLSRERSGFDSRYRRSPDVVQLAEFPSDMRAVGDSNPPVRILRKNRNSANLHDGL